MSNQKKLVEALKVFMERSVSPALGEGHAALNQWKYLSGILSNEPIDSAQLDFYLLMANKGNNTPTSTNTNLTQKTAFQPLQTSGEKFAMNRFGNNEIQSPTRLKATFGGQLQRKQLLGNMVNFQGTLLKNQQKLENANKKEPNTSIQLNTSSNTSYAGNKKFN